MHESDMMYIVVGFILAIAGFGIYAMQVFQAYLKEKKKIEEDFELSKKYEPKAAMGLVMVFIMIGSTGIMYMLVTTVILLISENYELLPNAAGLVSRFIMLIGATVFVADISRIPYSTRAMREFVYDLILPEDIKTEKDLQKRWEMEKEYYEKNGFEHPRRNFGKYVVFLTLPETMLMYIYLITILLIIFGGLMESEATDVASDLDVGFVSGMFATGVLYVVLTIPAIFSMKKSAEIEMTRENFGKKILVALYGIIPSIMGLVMMIYMVISLIGE